jgi:tetratricopeptide (TPR) repeat protein
VVLSGLASLILLAGTAPPGALEAAIARGDAHYADRARGARGATASPAQADTAIAEYKRALEIDPSSFEARLRLLRAYFFRGGFCGMDEGPEQIRLFTQAKRLAVDTVKRLEDGIQSSRLQAHREVLQREPLAAEIYLWAAISWGQWAVDHKVAAAWQGAAIQVRDLSQSVIELQPDALQAGGYLILGRLNSEAPRIPMLTRWVSRRKGVAYLRQAVALAPESTANEYFLADALLQWEPESAGEAKRLLEQCATRPPRPEYVVEDRHYAEMARERLEGLAAAGGGGVRRPESRVAGVP